MRVFVSLALALVVSTGIPAAATVTDDAAWGELEREFVVRINELRVSVGEAPLEVHANLREKARDWAATMAEEGHIWHSDLASGITADWQRLGENVGVGPGVESLHAAFVASPSHYENLVRGDFEYVGIGIVIADDRIYVAEEFMTPLPPPVVTAAPASAIAPPPPLASEDMERELARLAGDVDPSPADVLSGAEPMEGPERLTGVLRRLRLLDG